jgi:hypothetical protein
MHKKQANLAERMTDPKFKGKKEGGSTFWKQRESQFIEILTGYSPMFFSGGPKGDLSRHNE